jgi:hypothetical protein
MLKNLWTLRKTKYPFEDLSTTRPMQVGIASS